jgi:hypothetical protein
VHWLIFENYYTFLLIVFSGIVLSGLFLSLINYVSVEMIYLILSLRTGKILLLRFATRWSRFTVNLPNCKNYELPTGSLR